MLDISILDILDLQEDLWNSEFVPKGRQRDSVAFLVFCPTSALNMHFPNRSVQLPPLVDLSVFGRHQNYITILR